MSSITSSARITTNISIKASSIFQTHLGPLYDPEKHWTSSLRARSGYKIFDNTGTFASFTIDHRSPSLTKNVTGFITRHGRSCTANWRELLRCRLPVYHFEVVATAGGKSSKDSSFAIASSQVERVRRFLLMDIHNHCLLFQSPIWMDIAYRADRCVYFG